MKIEKIYKFYQASEEIYRCPICYKKIKAKKPASLVCQNGHCYNISKYGYIHFLPNQKPTKYQKELFESRRLIFEHGYYEPLAENMYHLVEEHQKNKNSFRVLDAGCGEGYYDWYLQNRLQNAEIYAFDNRKEAVKMGAQKCREIKWFVGNLANLPMQTETVDMLVEIFAPSNYSEFARVLKKDGCLLKVIPGEGYLKELRQAIGNISEKASYSSRPVEEYFSKHMKLHKKVELSYTRSVSAAIVKHFLQMSPLMFGKDISSVNAENINQLTFEFILLLGEKNS